MCLQCAITSQYKNYCSPSLWSWHGGGHEVSGAEVGGSRHRRLAIAVGLVSPGPTTRRTASALRNSSFRTKRAHLCYPSALKASALVNSSQRGPCASYIRRYHAQRAHSGELRSAAHESTGSASHRFGMRCGCCAAGCSRLGMNHARRRCSSQRCGRSGCT